MLANLAASLVIHDRVETTLPKAKELRRLADKIVTLSKSGSVASRRRAIVLIRNKKAVNKAFAELGARFAERKGGYTRILKLGYRHGDNAPMAAIEYIRAEHAAPHAEPKKAKKKPATKKAAEKKTAKKAEKKPAAKKTGKKAAPKKAAAKKSSAKKAPAKKAAK
jgi:large subunit ribosomal protein L17